MAHFNFLISQNAKWGHAGFYIDCHRITSLVRYQKIFFYKKSTDYNSMQGDCNLQMQKPCHSRRNNNSDHRGKKTSHHNFTSNQLSQMDPRDALPHAHCAVYLVNGGRFV